MIERLQSINEIKPLFKGYLDYMSQFFQIYDHDSWSKKAIKNLQSYSNAKDHLIFIFRKSGSIIGFAFVNKHLRFNNDGFAIPEFYIQKEYGKKGYGRKLAEHVFEQFHRQSPYG